MNLTPTELALIAAASTLAGGIFASILNALNNYLVKRSEERRHYRELIIKSAIENRKQQLEINKVAPPGYAYVRALDDYMIHMIAFSEILLEKKLNKKTIAKQVDELEDFLETFDAARALKYPEYKKPDAP